MKRIILGALALLTAGLWRRKKASPAGVYRLKGRGSGGTHADIIRITDKGNDRYHCEYVFHTGVGFSKKWQWDANLDRTTRRIDAGNGRYIEFDAKYKKASWLNEAGKVNLKKLNSRQAAKVTI